MRDSRWGIRNLKDVELAAKSRGLERIETVTMPANNLCVIFERQA